MGLVPSEAICFRSLMLSEPGVSEKAFSPGDHFDERRTCFVVLSAVRLLSE